LSVSKADMCTTWCLSKLLPDTNGNSLYNMFKVMDNYPLQSSSKYVQYVLLRKAFIYMQHAALQKEHLTSEGLMRIFNIHKRISAYYPDLKKQSTKNPVKECQKKDPQRLNA